MARDDESAPRSLLRAFRFRAASAVACEALAPQAFARYARVGDGEINLVDTPRNANHKPAKRAAGIVRRTRERRLNRVRLPE